MSSPRVFDDPHGDPFFSYVELDGKWLRIDEAALIEAEEESLRAIGDKIIADLGRKYGVVAPPETPQ